MKPMCYMNFGSGETHIVNPKGSAYFLRAGDALSCYEYNYHNPEWMIQSKIIKNEEGFFDFSKSLLDVGACYGSYVLCLPFDHNYVFEPNKESLAYIYANLLLQHKIWSSDIYNELVSNNHDEILFDGFTGGDISMEYNVHIETARQSIKCTMLDDHPELVNIGLIKMDVEGMEWRVIEGAVNTIKNSNYPPILFESWSKQQSVGNWETEKQYKERTDNLDRVLKELGYKVLKNWGDWETHLAIHQ